MKLLLDENLSRRILPLLTPHYPDSTQVALVGLQQADDRVVWQHARQYGFVIVTKDSDFHELSLLHGAPPTVIWLKLGNRSNDGIARALVEGRAAIVAAFGDGIQCLELY